MEIKNYMLVVTDIDKSVAFYRKVLGLHVIMDFGANKTLTGGLTLQTLETWRSLLVQAVSYLAAIIQKFILKKIILISLLSTLKSVRWNMSILSRNIHGDSG